ncbi:hypothetical protein MNEG_12047 [Monoraphidium neglectum]|uniref:Uncharacterized protein n=1 Tax=Monoraphidium neglectum TaxID=145388 RepID=A0A0D2LWR0_9CHLO|nr:hypothetical protein MNEG_12047 [Monoraphidium neglectum]KIY95914.1 hypothetical protein MNEG_12047 [Monoraphidium neglectum]|eukprot:XP_013894934.1 hypothetical protein MNEG_12047 [Monoraphidium neglectum]
MRDLSTGGPEGLWLMLEEAVNEINKRHGALAYAEASAEFFRSQASAIDAFKRLAAEEAARAGAEEADHVVVRRPDRCDLVWEKPAPSHNPLRSLFGGNHEQGPQEMVVVTLVVTARGVLDVPPVTNWPTLRKALQQVCGVSRSSIMAIELLWAPNNPQDFLSADDVRADYPDLVDLSTGRRVGGEPSSEAPSGTGQAAPAGAAP